MRLHASARLGAARRRGRARGFTLIELSIIVCIVGVLAVLGFLGYRRYVATARTSEATHLTSGIRMAQEAYKTEKGVYAAVSANQDSLYPSTTPGKFVTAWGGSCINCKDGDPNGWKRLAVNPHDPVMFGYATVAGVGGNELAAEPPPRGRESDFGPGIGSDQGQLKATDPYYVTVARGDTDGDGRPCIVLSYSTSTQLVVQAAGE
ncbi:MAG: pilA1 [Labilithrix sp.]|nr:pilA1 [Labilithrix sp.]